MLTLNDIINANFRKSGFSSGYKPEDVDAFLDKVKESYEQLLKTNIQQKETIASLEAENEQLVKKLDVLAQRVESYREDEDVIKNALISAQKLGEASIREARHKAEIILKDANLKAERIISAAEGEIERYDKELADLKQQVSDFRDNLLRMYKQHLTLITALPSQRREEPKEEDSQETETSVTEEQPKEEETAAVQVEEPAESADDSEKPEGEEPSVPETPEEPEAEQAEASPTSEEENEEKANGEEEYTLKVSSFPAGRGGRSSSDRCPFIRPYILTGRTILPKIPSLRWIFFTSTSRKMAGGLALIFCV